MGVVSGLVMAYQFGTNWSGFSQFAGSITGPLLTYEVLTAFFLEAGFLGVMLFGWNKVYHTGGEEVQPRSDFIPAEQHHAEESGLKEKGGQHFIGQKLLTC